MSEARGHAFGLDLARAAAVASVLLAHGSLFYAGPESPARYVLIVFGVVGVEIFFALSGFLVGRQLLRVAEGHGSAWRFMQRRWWRTLPNYYLFLAINAALAWWVVDRSGPDARFFMFAQSLAGPARSDFFPESWSLAVEEWFYLLAAAGVAIAAGSRLSARAVGMALVAIVIAWPLLRYAGQYAGLRIDDGVRKMSLLRLDALAYGLGAAWLERHRPDLFTAAMGRGALLTAAVLLGASVILLAELSRNLAFFDWARDTPMRWMVSLLFSALPLAAALCLPLLSRWETTGSPLAPAVRRISAWSYAIYLTHFPTLLTLLALWPVAATDTAQLALRTAVWLAVAVALAAVVYRWFEHPLTMMRPALEAPQPGVR